MVDVHGLTNEALAALDGRMGSSFEYVMKTAGILVIVAAASFSDR